VHIVFFKYLVREVATIINTYDTDNKHSVLMNQYKKLDKLSARVMTVVYCVVFTGLSIMVTVIPQESAELRLLVEWHRRLANSPYSFYRYVADKPGNNMFAILCRFVLVFMVHMNVLVYNTRIFIVKRLGCTQTICDLKYLDITVLKISDTIAVLTISFVQCFVLACFVADMFSSLFIPLERSTSSEQAIGYLICAMPFIVFHYEFFTVMNPLNALWHQLCSNSKASGRNTRGVAWLCTTALTVLTHVNRYRNVPAVASPGSLVPVLKSWGVPFTDFFS
jgi:hypothetical protein